MLGGISSCDSSIELSVEELLCQLANILSYIIVWGSCLFI